MKIKNWFKKPKEEIKEVKEQKKELPLKEKLRQVVIAITMLIIGVSFTIVSYEYPRVLHLIRNAEAKTLTIYGPQPVTSEDPSGDNASDDENTEELLEGIFTAYTSKAEQTDSSPYETASGLDLKTRFDCIVANNTLPFGTRIAIDGLGVCEVQDVGNARHPDNWFDVYMGNDDLRANEFGKRTLQYIVLE